MDMRIKGAAKRLILSLLLALGLGGCAVYGPPYSAYDSYYPGYAAPVYVGPPIALDLGFGFYDHGYRHHRGHGYRHHGGHGYRHHGGHHGGGHHRRGGHGRGRH